MTRPIAADVIRRARDTVHHVGVPLAALTLQNKPRVSVLYRLQPVYKSPRRKVQKTQPKVARSLPNFAGDSQTCDLGPEKYPDTLCLRTAYCVK